MPPNWQHYHQTGYAPIDEEHLEISHALERLLESVNAGRALEVAQALESVASLVSAHFEHEERLMQESAYPNAKRHKEAHDGFLADAGGFLLELKKQGLTERLRRWATGRLLEWFRFHIAANDVGLGQFLRARDQAAASEAPRVA